MLFDRRENLPTGASRNGQREQPCGAAPPCASGPQPRTATTTTVISEGRTVVRELDLNEGLKIDNWARYSAQSILFGMLDEYYVPTVEEAHDVLRWARVQ